MTRVVETKKEAEAVKEEAPVASFQAAVNMIEATPGANIVPSQDDAARWAEFLQERERVSMSIPSMKMQVPAIPGWHTHWVNDDEGRVERALRAKYVFVDEDEVGIHDYSIAGDSTKTGNQDMGSRVSMVVGTNKEGKTMRAYLMKLPEEIWRVDQMLQQKRNDKISAALRMGKIGAEEAAAQGLVHRNDLGKTYTRTVEVSRRDEPAPTSFGIQAEI